MVIVPLTVKVAIVAVKLCMNVQGHFSRASIRVSFLAIAQCSAILSQPTRLLDALLEGSPDQSIELYAM